MQILSLHPIKNYSSLGLVVSIGSFALIVDPFLDVMAISINCTHMAMTAQSMTERLNNDQFVSPLSIQLSAVNASTISFSIISSSALEKLAVTT